MQTLGYICGLFVYFVPELLKAYFIFWPVLILRALLVFPLTIAWRAVKALRAKQPSEFVFSPYEWN